MFGRTGRDINKGLVPATPLEARHWGQSFFLYLFGGEYVAPNSGDAEELGSELTTDGHC